MTIKERFTLYKNVTTGHGVVIDHKFGTTITEVEAEIICQKDYGHHFTQKSAQISYIIDNALSLVEKYNSMCEEGFEIRKQDLMNKIMKNDNLQL